LTTEAVGSLDTGRLFMTDRLDKRIGGTGKLAADYLLAHERDDCVS
jgi:predicted metalloprotease